MIPINEEVPACADSITYAKSPCPKIYSPNVPKFVSLNRILLLLTDLRKDDRFLLNVWWFSYRNFVKPKFFLQKLLERFDVPALQISSPPSNIPIGQYSSLEDAYFNIDVKTNIQLTVGKILLEWVENYYFDFDDKMVRQLNNFCSTRLVESGLTFLSKKIINAMKMSSRLFPWQEYKKTPNVELELESRNVSRSVSGSLRTNTIEQRLTLLRIEAKDLAETLTVMDNTIYKKIKFTEMLGQSWNKEKKKHMAPNILEVTSLFNKISNYVVFHVVSESNSMLRKKMIETLIKSVEYLRELNSFNMSMAIYSALGNSALSRLSEWTLLDVTVSKAYEDLVKLCSTENNQKTMRDAMDKCYVDGEACTPYIGIYLRDLVFTDDGNPTMIDGKLNFYKAVNQYSIMFNILRFQDRTYDINIKEDIQATIENYKPRSEDELYNMSLKVQPRKPNT